MEAGHLVAFNLALLAAWATPGPALLLALRNTLAGGRFAGIATGLGLATMAAGWTAAALLGLEVVFRLAPWAYGAVKAVGAAYLLWIAYAMWRDARRALDPVGVAPRRAVLSGLVLNLTNPKSVLFAGAVLAVIFPPDMSLPQKLLIVANHAALEIAAYTTFATLVSAPPVGRAYLRAKPALDRVASVVMAGLGLRLLADRWQP